MIQLRLTTTEPYSMFGTQEVKNVIHLDESNVKEIINEEKFREELMKDGRTNKPGIYIHGKAESLAGFDIPCFIDGDLMNLFNETEEQDILLLLPDGEYPCYATRTRECSEPIILITLKTEGRVAKKI